MYKRKNNYDRSVENWKYLLSNFKVEDIKNMSDMKKYVVGFGHSNKSFCYLVEAGTKELGDIRGARSSKFGLWYGTYGKDNVPKFRATKKNFGGDINKAFNDLKEEIVRIINKTIALKEFVEIDSFLSPMFKYKIMYLYNRDIMIPSFFFEDLLFFEDCLNLKKSESFEQAQKQLMNYRDKYNFNMNNYDFMCWLYNTYGKFNISKTKIINEREDDILNKKIIKAKEPVGDYKTHPVEKAQLKNSKGGNQYYPRDTKIAAIALKNANYQCEVNNKHDCFTRKSNNMPYTEVHHLIPLAYHYKFDKSLDIPENIVSLCSSCHNEIHYGKNADDLIAKLLNNRKEKLHQAGIEITIDRLLELYHRID